MNRKDRIRHISDIGNMRELREARREVEIELWYSADRLADDAAETFSVCNLLSIIAPPGSVADRIIDAINTGAATVRGVINAIHLIRSRR